MNIDYSFTLGAFREVEGKMEYLTRMVHEYVLSDEYLGRPGKVKQLVRGIQKIANNNEELLLPSFIGKVRHKIPHLAFKVKLEPFARESAKIIAAGVITNVLIDGGTYNLREEVERYETSDGFRKFRKKLIIMLGGEVTKDLFHGIELDKGVVHQHSVLGQRHKPHEMEFLKTVGSQPYKVWDGCTLDLLEKGYSLKKDWNYQPDRKKGERGELRVNRKRRIRGYAEKIMDHVKRFPQFFLSAKLDHRKRVYYEAARLEGIRPHGKLWETLMIDCAEPYFVDDEDVMVLKHLIYVTLHGRASELEAVQNFTPEDYLAASTADPMAAITEKEFGEAILLRKAAEAMDCRMTGEPCSFMFGLDFTNSGLMMAGISFHSPEMLKAANLGNHKTVHDSHGEFANHYGLPRSEIKTMHTALLHGSTNKTLCHQLIELTGDENHSEEEVERRNVQAYGECVRNITTVADWGSLVAGNRQNILRWTMPDGVVASSHMHLESVPVWFYAASARHKEGYVKYTIVSDMPLCEDSRGFSVYDKNTEVDGVSYPVKVKKRGLFADITHSCDAYVLRTVVRALSEAGYPFLLKHDDYITRPKAHRVVMAAARAAFTDLYQTNMYQKAMQDIADHSPYAPEVPALIMGKARNTASKSVNFLMP